jgi:ribosomal protein S12 methylthiotransferase
MIDLLEDVAFDRVGAFAYSVEDGTRAADMPDHVPDDVKEERLEELLEVQRGISFDANLELVGSRAVALVDHITDDDPEYGAVARTAAQAMDVDGVTNIRGAHGLEPGTMLEVEIVDALDYDLVAEVIR